MAVGSPETISALKASPGGARIDQRMYFLNLQDLLLSESYYVNGHLVQSDFAQIGVFKNLG